jgi:hypothetical protein
MAKSKTQAAVVASLRAEQSLQQIANCLGYLIVHAEEFKGQSNNELIPILASLGFDRSAIAGILQTTPETVSVRLSQLKAKSKASKTSKTNTN